jgi:hypothetical protein
LYYRKRRENEEGKNKDENCDDEVNTRIKKRKKGKKKERKKQTNKQTNTIKSTTFRNHKKFSPLVNVLELFLRCPMLVLVWQ